MRVLLVRPPVSEFTIGLKHIMICEPLELEYIGALLNNHEVKICDLLVENNFEEYLSEFQPEIIASSAYKAGTNEVIKLFRKAKTYNPDIITVAGGVHATLVPEDYADVSVDIIGIGDGTFLMKELVDCIALGESLWQVAGLAFPVAEKKLVFTEKKPYMPKADSLPLPNRDLIKHIQHKYYYLMHQPVVTMKTTWGCWYRCNFCFTWKITDGLPYSRSPESIVQELLTIEAEDIYIVDDIFLINKTRLRKLADLIKEHQIQKKYLVYARADFIAENEDIIAEWANLGLVAVFIGLEAALDEELEAMNKECDVSHNTRAIDILRKYKIDTYGSLIPDAHYTQKDWERLWKFIKDNQLYYVNISPMTPLPGAETYAQQKHLLTVPEDAHGFFDLSHIILPTKTSLKTYYRQLLKTYSKTILNIYRANQVTQRTLPSVWTWKYWKVIWGTLKIGWQFWNAHKHHSPKGIAKAQYKGEVPLSLSFENKFEHISFQQNTNLSKNAV
ncbi:MAG: B12-binding domain-containing radical SAM protein [Raineya sp.]|jgi:radical SAM superfamily enzyme YgiQ (UPF0313 family)|nr:B12-binding domain-containing radical SAM protein [Raineya sp.]